MAGQSGGLITPKEQPPEVWPRWGDQIRELADELLDSRARPQLVGDAFTLTPAIEKLKVVGRLLRTLSPQDPTLEPTNLESEVTTHANTAVELAIALGEFDPQAVPDPNQSRQQLLNRIESERNWFAVNVGPRLMAPALDLRTQATEMSQLVAQLQSQAEEANQALLAIRKAAGSSAAVRLSEHYETASTGHGRVARRFLVVFTGGLIATVALGYYLLVVDTIKINPSNPDHWVDFAIQLVPRVFYVGILGYLVAFAGRNYRVNKHLQVANAHRRNALETYPLLAEAVKSEWALDRVTLALVTAIVSEADTGYLQPAKERTIVESLGIGGIAKL